MDNTPVHFVTNICIYEAVILDMKSDLEDAGRKFLWKIT
jgi:hypothetical protein